MNKNRLHHVLERVYESEMPAKEDLVQLLSLNAKEELSELYCFADQVRKEHVGDGILMRGIVEFSSYCRNKCLYCGLNANNKSLERYRMTKQEIVDAIKPLVDCGLKTVVLQSGEDEEISPELLADVLREIKSRYGIAITLSVGEWPFEAYKLWNEAGADRYLLKIEASVKDVYEKFHPEMSYENRIRCLKDLRTLGYQVGSGSLVGLKGQTPETYAEDILFFKKFNFDMIGIGLFIPHKQTELGEERRGDLDMTLKVLALTRIVTRNTHLPATTATGSLGGRDNRIDALQAGANVIMPNFTPLQYRKLYEIYPNKRCVDEKSGECRSIEIMAKGIGRFVDYSRGDSLKV